MMWGLVLSGGAAWGIANAGVLEVFEREGLRPDCIAGSSMGAIVAGLYAYGVSPATMRELIEEIKPQKVATVVEKPFDGYRLHNGLLRQSLKEHLSHLIGDAAIGDCKIPFICVAGRVKEPIHWRHIIKEGFSDQLRACVDPHVFPPETPLIDALMATSAIPVIFAPYRVGADSFVDLVTFGAIPARSLRAACHPDIVIATDTNPKYERAQRFLPKGWKEFLEDGYASLEESKKACDLILTPHFRFNHMRFDKAKEMYEAGVKITEERMSEIRDVLGFIG